MMACPYGARYFYEEVSYYFGDKPTPHEKRVYCQWTVGTVLKCDFCKDRVDEGRRKGLNPGVDREATPACVVNCMANARFFGDLDDPESTVCRLAASGRGVQLLPELGTNPQVYYLLPVFRPSLSSEPDAFALSVSATSAAFLPSEDSVRAGAYRSNTEAR
jgi:Fe-S-cluster-containing dehydrogenase component